MCRAGGVAGAASVLLVLAWTGVGADLYHEYGGVKLPHYDYEAAGGEGDGQGEAAEQYRDPDDYAKHGERRSPAPPPTPAPHEPQARAQARQPRRRERTRAQDVAQRRGRADDRHHELDDAPDNQTLDDKYSNEDVPKLKSKSKLRRSKELRDISEELTRALEGGPRIETEEGRRRGWWGGTDESDVEYALPPSGEEHYPLGLEESGLDALGVGGAPVGGAGAPVDGRAPLPADGPTDNYDSYDMKRVYKLKDKLPPLLRRTTPTRAFMAPARGRQEQAAP